MTGSIIFMLYGEPTIAIPGTLPFHGKSSRPLSRYSPHSSTGLTAMLVAMLGRRTASRLWQPAEGGKENPSHSHRK